MLLYVKFNLWQEANKLLRAYMSNTLCHKINCVVELCLYVQVKNMNLKTKIGNEKHEFVLVFPSCVCGSLFLLVI